MSALDRIRERAKETLSTVVRYGIPFLNDVMGGIGAGELVIAGAGTGIGKTEILSIIAQHVGKTDRVCFYALEAHQDEIEERILYRLVSDAYFRLDSGKRPKLPTGWLNFPDYHRGFCGDALRSIEEEVRHNFEAVTKNITFQYPREVSPDVLCLDIGAHIQDGYALFIVDHLHALEYSGEEHDGIKNALRLCDRIVNDRKTAMLVASHLRKPDRFTVKSFPDISDLHGSSEISKKATGVFLIGQHHGGKFGATDHEACTLFQVPKFRLDGGAKRYFGMHKFDTRARRYSSNYILMSRSYEKNAEVFNAYDGDKPFWAKSGLVYRDVHP